ncbi:MAG: aminomethyl-transferring glycine dehydrogenase [Bacteroidia bacterium]|nr:MAG: aminomethyl-transferring glycine dehydrogenase [Bacteroidia bacterium]
MTYNLFMNRHIGPNDFEQQEMLQEIGFNNLDEFVQHVIPNHLLSTTPTTNAPLLQENEGINLITEIAKQNICLKNYIGMGYYDTITPNVIKRNVFENPGWYTAYTPYQAEISQGRLEVLLNFQQMIIDLTGLSVSNASLLDEATAASEAMSMAKRINPQSGNIFFVDQNTYPQTIDVIKTRAEFQQITVEIGDITQLVHPDKYFAILVQNPNFYGKVADYSATFASIKSQNPKICIIMAYDPLSLILFKSPKKMGADIVIGSTQRFGIPIGFGGPSAAFIATHEKYVRLMPGRIIGISQDSTGKNALRMSLQTREQHIRREKATSNICTSQVLLANMATFYAIYHGFHGLKKIAEHIHHLALQLKNNLIFSQIAVIDHQFIFDTICVEINNNIEQIYEKFINAGIAVGKLDNKIFIALGETASIEDMLRIVTIITGHNISNNEFIIRGKLPETLPIYQHLYRDDPILQQKVFNSYHSETAMMRYLKRLENRDISLVHSMIPLGSCTMKLNAAVELEALSWPSFANIHPFAPLATTRGFLSIIHQLSEQLKSITGFSAIAMQPNSGAQGELAGLIAIRRYLQSINQDKRNICLIPKSAHGTNPASAYMMGFEVVVVNCADNGNVDIADLKAKAELHQEKLACLMITYPSTHGVFEPDIKHICDIIHNYGGQVYMDGANLNAMVGLIKPAEIGADVSHINLHKTFAIPHGGGGPGMGPIGVKAHLVPFLPKHAILDHLDSDNDNNHAYHAVSSSPYGSALILIISWMYCTLLGNDGLKKASQIAILNANYIAKKLAPYYPILYTGQYQPKSETQNTNQKINKDFNTMTSHVPMKESMDNINENSMENLKKPINLVAHECIIDLRPIKEATHINEVDIAKRLMDYGFHAPTMSFPVAGTLMIEPTESENKTELDKFINAMISIYHEIEAIKNGQLDKDNNPLKNAPHTLTDLLLWDKPYSQQLGCCPNNPTMVDKIFPTVNRINDVYGDRNFSTQLKIRL